MKLKRDATSRRAEQSTLSRKERNNRIGKHKQNITMSSIYGNGRAAAVLRSRFKKERNAYSSDVDSDVSSGSDSGSRNFLCVGCCYNSCFIYSCSCCAEMTHYMAHPHTHTHAQALTMSLKSIQIKQNIGKETGKERDGNAWNCKDCNTAAECSALFPLSPLYRSRTPCTIFLLSNFHL